MASDDVHRDRDRTVVAMPDAEIHDAMQLARTLGEDGRYDVRVGPSFSATEDEVCEVAQDAEVIAVGLAPVTRRVLETCHSLKIVVKCGIGTEYIDVAAAADRGVLCVRTAGANVAGVAEYVIAGVLDHARSLRTLQVGAETVGEWAALRARWAGRLPELRGQVLGLIGFGGIARHTAGLAAGFGMTVIAHDPYVDVAGVSGGEVASASLDEVLTRSDVVSVHATLTSENYHLIDAAALSVMKDTALLVNTARGGLVDQAAVGAALHDGRLGGAVLDVLEVEPAAADDPILSAPRCLITPHLAGCTATGYREIGATAARLIDRYVSGEPIDERHVVPVEAGSLPATA